MEQIVSAENQIVNIILIAIILLIVMSVAIVLFFYFSRRKIVRSELEKATMQIKHQKDVIQFTLITQEAERNRIAQDLHDAISSKLNIVSLNANILTEENIPSTDANKIGNSILKVTTNVLESSRKIAHALLPPTLDKFGFQAALEELCEEVSETGAFKLNYRINYDNEFLSSESELHLFRIVQELFNNSIKHAEASEINLKIETLENLLTLNYTDDGKGFEYEEKKMSKGLGMNGLENRVAILNGSFNFETSPGNGINVTIMIG